MTQSYFDAKADFRNITSKVKQQPNSKSQYHKTTAFTNDQKNFSQDILGFYESEDDKDVSIMDSLNNISHFLGGGTGGGGNSNTNSFNQLQQS